MEIRELILKIVSEDKSILGRREEFLKKLESYSPNPKDFAAIKRAVQSVNIAEMFLTAEGKSAEDMEATVKSASEKLKNIGLQESRVDFIIDAFKYTIDTLNSNLDADLDENVYEESDEPSPISLEKPQNYYIPQESEPAPEEATETPKNTWVCSCGKENDGNFCIKCGRSRYNNIPAVNANTNPPNLNSNIQSNSESNSKSLYFFIVAAACVVVVGFFIGASFTGSDNKTASNTVQTQKSDNKSKNTAQPQNAANPSQATPTKIQDTAPAQAPTGNHWICDANGVYLWNPEPTSGETITWSGGYVVENGYKYADGRGIVQWYKNGKLEQVDEGQFIIGRHNGHFTHKFSSGKVIYSNWDHGTELN